jgi:hypothetical protein
VKKRWKKISKDHDNVIKSCNFFNLINNFQIIRSNLEGIFASPMESSARFFSEWNGGPAWILLGQIMKQNEHVTAVVHIKTVSTMLDGVWQGETNPVLSPYYVWENFMDQLAEESRFI